MPRSPRNLAAGVNLQKKGEIIAMSLTDSTNSNIGGFGYADAAQGAQAQIRTWAELAEQSAESAAASKDAAQLAAQNAQTSNENATSAASAASASASAASASATAAQQAASSAETYKNDAQQAAATAATDAAEAVQSVLDQAQTYANNAQQAATAAGNSYAAAEQAAGNAANSATDAETAKSNAQTYANNAQTSATQAADSAANAANLSAAAQNSAQAAANSAELAASLVVNATQLGLTKATEGSYEIFQVDSALGGLGLARPLDRLPLSVCFRIKISSQTVGDIYAGNEGVITDSTAAGFCLYKISASQSSLVVGGGAYAGATVSFDDSTLADGNWHAVAIVLNSNGKVFVDGELVATSSNFSSGLARFTSPGQFYFGKSSGGRFELSNMKAFNFDISASGAPLTSTSPQAARRSLSQNTPQEKSRVRR